MQKSCWRALSGGRAAAGRGDESGGGLTHTLFMLQLRCHNDEKMNLDSPAFPTQPPSFVCASLNDSGPGIAAGAVKFQPLLNFQPLKRVAMGSQYFATIGAPPHL